jgi:photosystem II stability/assembly factor-like uncharacterized protein
MKKRKALQTISIMACLLLCMSAAHAAGTWEVMQSGTTRNLQGITGFDMENIYAVGASGTILNYNGSTWAAQSSGTSWTLYDVYGTDPGNIYAVGDYRGIFRNTGSGWSRINHQSLNRPLYAFGGPSAASGELIGVGQTQTIWVFFVRQYYNTVSGTNNSFSSQEHHLFSNSLRGLFTTPGGDVIVAGDSGLIAHYQGKDFWGHHKYSRFSTPTSRGLKDVWGTDINNLFAVGDSGTILRRADGGSWVSMQSNTSANLTAVWGTALDNVYAVGAGGTVMHFNGSTWSKITVPTTQQLNNIWGNSANEIFVVGNGGVIINYIGSQECYCPDESIGIQYRNADNTGWEPCSCAYYSAWCDPTTGICWQDPQKDYLTPDYPGIVSYDAERYCEELVALGYEDWRLPDINELRSLIRGNPDTEFPNGICPMWDGSTFEDGQNTSCFGGSDGNGPGIEGCYWPESLNGSCHRPDPATHGIHPLEYWAVGAASNRPDWIASVLFDLGAVTYNHINSLGEVRCIRDEPTVPVACEEYTACEPGETRQCTAVNGKPGAQACSADGTCWGPCESTSFDATPPPDDVCDQCDQMIITIRVPEELPAQPDQLMAFFYDAEGWAGIPMGPPDGGTDENVILNPAISPGNPYTMVLPACTYYRENCLVGDYQVFVGLYFTPDFPPLPQDGDYVWGHFDLSDAGLVTLGGGMQETYYLDITLEKCVDGYCDLPACPDPAMPYQCPDGECRADADDCCGPGQVRCEDDLCYDGACPTCGAGEPIPDDSDVWGCRFSNNYDSNSCADFAECDGWPNDQAAIEAACLATGSGASNCVCTRGASCRKERAMTSGTTQCTFKQDGKNYYAYGMPSIGCSFGGGSNFTNSPICGEYCE